MRTKGKALKALLGDGVPYFGDHVELSDNATDFASTVGVGGVVGSQFTLPAVASRATQFDLTPARRKIFEKWVALYKEKMLSEGQYEGTLYDIGFDRPEAHAIKKGDGDVLRVLCSRNSREGGTARIGRSRVQSNGLRKQQRVLGTVHGPIGAN